jgi:hypothetical protein
MEAIVGRGRRFRAKQAAREPSRQLSRRAKAAASAGCSCQAIGAGDWRARRWQTDAISAADELKRFDEDTAFDRQVLEAVVGRDVLLRELPTSSTDDLRGLGVAFARTVSDSLGAEAVGAMTDRFRPLLFATSWKLLDLIVELAGRASGAAPAPGRWWPIRQKVAWVRTTSVPAFEPFQSDRHLWRLAVKLYARLEESRNAIVHRRHRRDTPGAVIPYGRSGRPLRPVSPAEVDALVYFSYGLAEEVASGIASTRRRVALTWRADQLRGLTRLVARSSGPPPSLRRIIVNLAPAGRRWRLDLAAIRAHLTSQDASTQIADIEAHMPDGSVFVGRLDDAPTDAAVEFAASRPPRWLRRQESAHHGRVRHR